MTLVEGPPSLDAIGQMARLVLPCTKDGAVRFRDFALNREQLTALVTLGIDALDAMDQAQAEDAAKVVPMIKAG